MKKDRKKDLRDRSNNITIREFLSSEDSSTSSSIFCFHGVPDWKEDKASFVEISDCNSKIKLHKQPREEIFNFILRLKVLRDILTEFVIDLETENKITSELQLTVTD